VKHGTMAYQGSVCASAIFNSFFPVIMWYKFSFSELLGDCCAGEGGVFLLPSEEVTVFNKIKCNHFT
jgi:hypothetical protein